MEKLKAYAKWVILRARRLEPERDWAELTVVLTDDAGMTRANRACFGKDTSTDVISQAYAPMPPESLPTAEVIVNVERAANAGPHFGGPSRELARYLAHGCQHLAGATDEDEGSRTRMHRRERAWLMEAESLHLLDGLTEEGENQAYE